MKTKILIAALLAVLLIGVAGAATIVNAQRPTPTVSDQPWGGRGGGMFARDTNAEGPLHEYMITAFAEKLGIPAEDLEARIDGGETMAEIATAEGLSLDEFRAVMLDARSQAIDQALADGTLTQEQADWMKQRGAGMMGGQGYGAGRGAGMMGGGGMMRRGAGAGTGVCPFAQ